MCKAQKLIYILIFYIWIFWTLILFFKLLERNATLEIIILLISCHVNIYKKNYDVPFRNSDSIRACAVISTYDAELFRRYAIQGITTN